MSGPKRSMKLVLMNVEIELEYVVLLTDIEWHAEHKFLKTFSPLAASPPPAAFFLGGIF